MFRNKKKSKKFTKEFDLLGKDSNEVAFTLRITESRVDIETKTKDWKVKFSVGSYEYSFITQMLIEKRQEELHLIAVALFVVRVIFRDPALIQEIYNLVDNSVKNRLQKPVSEKDDQIILAEEKVLHEKSVESIEQLEELNEKQEAVVVKMPKPRKKKKE